MDHREFAQKSIELGMAIIQDGIRVLEADPDHDACKLCPLQDVFDGDVYAPICKSSCPITWKLGWKGEENGSFEHD